MINNPVYWALSKFRQNQFSPLNWLHPNELDFFRNLKFEKRKNDWLNGRYIAKKLIAPLIGIEADPTEYAKMDIKKADDGAPEIYIDNSLLPGSLSISHGHDYVMCAFSKINLVGCDLEKNDHRSDQFIKDFFTPSEFQKFLNLDKLQTSLQANLFWSAKESALKINRKGLSRDTRSIEIDNYSLESPENWTALLVKDGTEHLEYHGYWKYWNDLLLVILSNIPKPTMVEIIV